MFEIFQLFLFLPIFIYFQKSWGWKADAWLVPNWDVLTNLLELSNIKVSKIHYRVPKVFGAYGQIQQP
jgi:hypothetical protein